ITLIRFSVSLLLLLLNFFTLTCQSSVSFNTCRNENRMPTPTIWAMMFLLIWHRYHSTYLSAMPNFFSCCYIPRWTSTPSLFVVHSLTKNTKGKLYASIVSAPLFAGDGLDVYGGFCYQHCRWYFTPTIRRVDCLRHECNRTNRCRYQRKKWDTARGFLR